MYWNIFRPEVNSPMRSAVYFTRPSAKEKCKNSETVVEIEADELAYT